MRSNVLGSIAKQLEDAGLELVHLETIEQGINMLITGRVDSVSPSSCVYTTSKSKLSV